MRKKDIENIKQKYQQYLKQQRQQQHFDKEREYCWWKQPKKYKKSYLRGGECSEPEIEQKEYVPEEKEEIEEPKKETKRPVQRRNNIFDYLNNNAKRNKR